jgi:CheY-like chemotaxis protein
VDTEINQGTTFHLYFPAFSVTETPVPHLADGMLPPGQGQLVLLVEDEAAIRNALAERLNLLNYEVLEAANGREALNLLGQRGDDIALVISDAIMPEMGGIALFHTLQERHLALPFIMITGHAMEKDMENLRALGLDGWLTKPPDLARLAQMLQEILS